ncbi:hypothetical protein GW835_00050 [archaeon]|nr:hypothetical protein [archaeon]NCP78948.1 hypothetical protein [archaeon]NCP98549.1 hypothetical protein [archaeon]NCQ06715.1 hypothetical protein [archaeon]NCQ50511.1 hypothetical protein [archaeon]
MKKIYLVAIFAIVVAFALLLSFSSTKDKGLTTEKEYPYTMSSSDDVDWVDKGAVSPTSTMDHGITTEDKYPYTFTSDKGITTEKEYPYIEPDGSENTDEESNYDFSDEKYGIETEKEYPYNG